jgi:hypothetical protein
MKKHASTVTAADALAEIDPQFQRAQSKKIECATVDSPG